MPSPNWPEPDFRKPPRLTNSAFATRVLIAVGITATVVLLLWLIGRVLEIFLVFFAAILFGVLLSNLSRHVHQLTRLPYKGALAVVVIGLFGLLAAAIYFLAPSLVSQGQELADSLPKALDKLLNHVRTFPLGEQVLSGIPSPETLFQSKNGIADRLMGIFSTTLSSLVNFLIIVVIGIYLAINPPAMVEGVVKLVPVPKRARAREVLYTIGITLWGWLKGTLLAMVLIGTVTTTGLMIIGVPMALILGIIAGLFEFVPNIGPFIAGLPAILLALLISPVKALWVLGLFVVVQSLEGWILTPLVQKRVIDLPPVLTISAQLLLGVLTGVLGLILAVPLMGALMVLVKMLYIEDVLGDRQIEVKGEEKAKEAIDRNSSNLAKDPE